MGFSAVEDDKRTGRPLTVTTAENVERVSNLVMQDRRVSVSFIAETLRISRERVEHIIKRVLRMRKVSARWVPRLLTPEQTDIRCAMSRENLRLFQQDPGEFVTRFVTVDETWVHHYEPETKQQSMQWKHSDSPPHKKAKAVPSAQKVMAMVGDSI